MRALILICFALCLSGQEDLVANRERVRASLKKMQAKAKQKEDYLFQRRLTKRELMPDGSVKSETVSVLRRDPWEDQVVTRLIEKDGKALTAEEITKQEERLRRSVIEMRKTPMKPRFEEETWMDEMPDALEIHKGGMEEKFGRMAEVYWFRPQPGYKAKTMRAKAFEKIRGKVWVDQQDGEMTRLEVEIFDTISVGFGLLGKLEKGTNFEMERKKWEIGVWFEVWQRVRYDLRVMMVKSLRQEIETHWSNLSPRPPVKMIRSGS
ncbi:MAG: hypothetical protein NTW74_16595 [Acidobacteria bacterium]|nr:hypothetical protein [Acidobacteriota bacterium]